MSKLPDKYNPKEVEKKWREEWRKENKKIYQWRNDLPREQTFVIDTPPPTVSGLLHMGHVFSYTQADFVARFNRMQGKDVFYPMGFDDNGLPTERLVEKIIGKKAMIYEAEEVEKNGGGNGYFVKKCREIVTEAEEEFENLFNEIALSVDWEQKYQTISPESQKISQASFVDLYKKGLVEERLAPTFWDISDRTALAKADIIDKEIEGEMHYLKFALMEDSVVANEYFQFPIMTTRPELLPACVALMINTSSELYQKKIKQLIDTKTAQDLENNGSGATGLFAITPIFGVMVPIIVDNESVQADKGTGAVMCCTYGDETDLEWQRKYSLPSREIIAEDGKLANLEDAGGSFDDFICRNDNHLLVFTLEKSNIINVEQFLNNYQKIAGLKIKEARQKIIEILAEFLIKSEKILRPVKCAERSGVAIEIISTVQWFIKILPFKEQLKQKARECNWYPDYMRVRIEQWIDGLSWDWCISRQRFFGVKFPVWHLKSFNPEDSTQVKFINPEKDHFYDPNLANKTIIADISQLPTDPEIDIPANFILLNKNEIESAKKLFYIDKDYFCDESDFNKKIVKDSEGKLWFLTPETAVMDTWATSSITPQLSSKGISAEICFDNDRHAKLFPADMRPQAHEIIRSWAFYTIVKAYLHSLEIEKDADGKIIKNADNTIKLKENSNQKISIPWYNLMISGWCLASDKTKMSKSKGNVVTPTALIEEKSADVVRYWASASNLGADIAYSEEIFKIGQKLITKIFNASKFCAQHFAILTQNLGDFDDKKLLQNISATSDLWIIARLNQVIKIYNQQFQIFEYARARDAIEEFFWKDFCDNYLEICKVRSYGLDAEKLVSLNLSAEQKQQIISEQISAVGTLYLCLKNILKLFAPFIPHITEEIYATIFTDEFDKYQSIHARGNHADIAIEFIDENTLPHILAIGAEMLKIIFEVRKFKSENNLSMKTPIKILQISSQFELLQIISDLANVCNATEIITTNKIDNIALEKNSLPQDLNIKIII